MRTGCVVIAFISLCLAPPTALGEQDARLAAKLERIKGEVSRGEGEIARLRAEFNDLQKQRKELGDTAKRLEDEERGLLLKVEDISQEREGLMRQVRLAEARVDEQQRAVVKRLRALYMSSSPNGVRASLWRADGGEVERVAVYVRAVRAADEARFAQVKRSVSDLMLKRQKVDDTFKREKDTQDSVTATRKEATTQAQRLKALGEQIAQKQKAAERSLAKLRKEADSLEELLAGMLSAASPTQAIPERGDIEPLRVTPKPVPREQQLVVGRVGGDAPAAVVLPPTIELVPGGLFASVVRASPPVSGAVLQRFGKVKVADFTDMIFSKGVEFSATVGAQVFAVLAAKVAFVGSLPGYETVVVLDHGSRSYSLYGRLGASLVRAGELVRQDQAIGTTGAPDARARNFYFEVRKNGTPVNPELILKRLSR